MLLVMGNGERTIFEINSEHSVLLSKSRPHEKLLYQSLIALGKEKNLTPAYFRLPLSHKGRQEDIRSTCEGHS